VTIGLGEDDEDKATEDDSDDQEDETGACSWEGFGDKADWFAGAENEGAAEALTDSDSKGTFTSA